MTGGAAVSGGLEEAQRVELTVAAVAPGGHCVARVDGQVVFVRHALPGERVLAEVTEVHRGFVRADAVSVLEAAPDRVTPPCPYARPGRCGGCDLQHVAPPAQLDWKAKVVREQLVRLGGLDETECDALGVRVEPLPGGPLGWRSRVRYAVDAAGRAGLLKHRSHEVVPVDRCLIAHPAIQDLPVLTSAGVTWPDAEAVEAVASTGGDVAVTAVAAGRTEVVSGPDQVRERAAGRDWSLPASSFWQVHPAAADTLVAAVLELTDPQPGEIAWDLYGGAGLFAAALAGRVGAGGRITLVEAAADGVAAARENLRDLPVVEVVAARVETALTRRRITGPVDVVVLDPPRSGAGARVVRDVVAAGPRAVAYVACDPAAFARDVRVFTGLGWRLAELRGYDLFPMTQHVELVGLLLPG
ncbi:tRNA/tmRNA/rRNA uracil-C5-methylase, TrmA/RlmC/RlmD family [Micromonospora phaseoli]|uniref:tRNA/tmRNA/rRNA uracil-C5-methylase, TrmA/RlmC/RlmD family n=1 Tax=Micromonospora phaseoli TaxID=1144548 RepID=A0A1H6S201_9ACTN|nr:23S rRNA m(5)U-1939 methyltransferase [Micromonospora phaseoli]SEI58787.1 tRNA/tmRNA/rRNA uracil-C5-methylase, TrmA/RlmC/RlmD family [Micromonospora phaseoli]